MAYRHESGRASCRRSRRADDPPGLHARALGAGGHGRSARGGAARRDRGQRRAAGVGRDLDADFAGLQWTITGYTLTLAALILLGGSLGDRFGRRRVFVIGTCGSASPRLLCGAAPNVEVLVAARMLQGVGGALLTPGSLAIIESAVVPDGPGPGDRRLVGARRRRRGGRTAASAATWSRPSWRRGVPAQPAAGRTGSVAIARATCPSRATRDATGRLDLPGAVLAALGLGGMTYALIAAAEATGAGPVVIAVAGRSRGAGRRSSSSSGGPPPDAPARRSSPRASSRRPTWSRSPSTRRWAASSSCSCWSCRCRLGYSALAPARPSLPDHGAACCCCPPGPGRWRNGSGRAC